MAHRSHRLGLRNIAQYSAYRLVPLPVIHQSIRLDAHSSPHHMQAQSRNNRRALPTTFVSLSFTSSTLTSLQPCYKRNTFQPRLDTIRWSYSGWLRRSRPRAFLCFTVWRRMLCPSSARSRYAHGPDFTYLYLRMPMSGLAI